MSIEFWWSSVPLLFTKPVIVFPKNKMQQPTHHLTTHYQPYRTGLGLKMVCKQWSKGFLGVSDISLIRQVSNNFSAGAHTSSP